MAQQQTITDRQQSDAASPQDPPAAIAPELRATPADYAAAQPSMRAPQHHKAQALPASDACDSIQLHDLALDAENSGAAGWDAEQWRREQVAI